MSKILRYPFTEPNVTTLFTILSNSKQTQNYSAQDLSIILMVLRQNILFVSNEGRYGYREGLVQDILSHSFLVGLRNVNIRHELNVMK